MGESKLSPRRVEAALKQRQALELRIAGRTWQEIADHVGYSNHSGAIAAVKSALSKTLQEPADELRALMKERYEKMIQVYWPSLIRGDISSGKLCLSTMAAERELLGLDAPTKVEYSGPDGSAIKHEVITFDVNDFEGAFTALREAGVIRLAPDSSNGSTVDGSVHPTQADT